LDTCSLPHRQFLDKFVKPKPGRTLIVGSKLYPGRSDRRSEYADAVGVDMLAGDGVDVVANLEDDDAAVALGQFAHIECWSVLEHSRRPWLLATNLERLLEPGGTIHVTVPFAWRPHGYPDDFWRFSASCLRDVLFTGIRWERLMLAQAKLRDNGRVPVMDKGMPGEAWIARTEVLGFGVRT